jgi:hypothetical protein
MPVFRPKIAIYGEKMAQTGLKTPIFGFFSLQQSLRARR